MLTLALVVLLCFVILYFLVRKIYSYVEDKISLHTYRSNLHFIAEPEELLNEEDRWNGFSPETHDGSDDSSLGEEVVDTAPVNTPTVPMSDPDELTREQAYWERFRSDANYSKKKWKWDDYEKKLIEGLAFDAHNGEVLRALADYYFTYNQTKKALPLLKKIVEEKPDDHKALWQIAEIYLESGDLETSELLVSKAMAINPENPKYAITMTEVYYNTDRVDDAIKSMEDVVKRRPSHIGYREALARLYEEVREYELAQHCYQSIVEIDPNNIKAKKKALEIRNKM